MTKMADSPDNDQEKVSRILYSSEYCHIRKRIERMFFFCVDSVNCPTKNTKQCYARQPQEAEQA